MKLSFYLLGLASAASFECDCDVTWMECDFNCCCDAYCAPNQRALFTGCTPLVSANDKQGFCTFSRVVATSNEAAVERDMRSNSAFCVAVDNNQGWEFDETDSLSSNEVDTIVNLATITPSSTSDQLTDITYQVDTLLRAKDTTVDKPVLFKSPSAKFGRQCVDTTIGYKKDEANQCIMKNTAETCAKASLEYYQRFEFDSGNSSYITPSIICVDEDGTSLVCENSSHDGTQCTKSVVKAQYEFFDTETPGVIESVDLTLTLADVTGWISRQSTINFYNKGDNPDTTTHLSGNPGYLSSRPVIMGTLNGSTIADTSVLTIMSHESCGDDSKRQEVIFGRDYHVGCTITFSSGSPCTDHQSDVDNILGTVQSYVGQWGDAALFTTASQYADKWRQVLSTNPDACDTMQLMTGRQIDILYEKTGSVLNPQKKIVAVRSKSDPKVAGTTTDNVTFVFRITTRVNFVDISSRPDQLFAAPPSINVQLPPGFMAPFRSSDGEL